MLLCDIGNTSYHFKSERATYKKSVASFDPASIEEDVYYISVNSALDGVLASLANWIDLAQYVDRSRYYPSMGIDRVVAVESLHHGIIIDAGSAITVDVVREGIFEGGFIYPGLQAMEQTYANISPALAYAFNFEVNLHNLPKNSQDAISYGFLKTLYSEVVSYNLPIILTGGDAQVLAKVFTDARVDETVLFEGMKKLINKL